MKQAGRERTAEAVSRTGKRLSRRAEVSVAARRITNANRVRLINIITVMRLLIYKIIKFGDQHFVPRVYFDNSINHRRGVKCELDIQLKLRADCVWPVKIERIINGQQKGPEGVWKCASTEVAEESIQLMHLLRQWVIHPSRQRMNFDAAEWTGVVKAAKLWLQ